MTQGHIEKLLRETFGNVRPNRAQLRAFYFGNREGEREMRAKRTVERHVKRKLKAGRPGKPGFSLPPTFSWEAVVKASQKKAAS